jgi:dimethylamine/trimethylamine dehydrogenase
MLQLKGHRVTYVTPLPVVSSWTQMTDEQSFVQSRLMALDVELVLSHRLAGFAGPEAQFACVYSGRNRRVPGDALVLVTGRVPNDALYHELTGRLQADRLSRIGDCLAPSHIADAVFSGHRFARNLDEPRSAILRRERPEP